MKKIIFVCLCTILLLTLSFTSLASKPKSLVPANHKIAFPPNGDPDGPYDGGLDDITDWENLVRGIAMVLLFTANTIGTDFTDIGASGNYRELVSYIFWGVILLVSAAMYLGEAFDRYEDRFNDGC